MNADDTADDTPTALEPHRFAHHGVAAARELLASLDGRPLADHPDVYGAVHEHLSAALASVDDA